MKGGVSGEPRTNRYRKKVSYMMRMACNGERKKPRKKPRKKSRKAL